MLKLCVQRFHKDYLKLHKDNEGLWMGGPRVACLISKIPTSHISVAMKCHVAC